MKKVITYNGYTYYIGNDKNGTFYNIVPADQQAPNGGYTRVHILKVKGLPDLFDITPQEVTKLKRVKRDLLTDKNATFSSQTRNNNYLLELATKYKVSTQVISDAGNN